MPCSHCPTEKVFARGYCQACYYRLRRNGSVERKNVVNTGSCSVEGCGEHSFAKNLCKVHYDRAQHPMKATWKLLRSRHKGIYPPAWDDFEAFLAAVGERPSPKHQLRRPDASSPFSAENIGWLEPIGEERSGYSKDEQSAYGREWNLRNRFGMDSTEYKARLERQGNACAICKEPETRIDKRSREPKALAVDHDHKTGKVRGLLCAHCNTGLGLFDDDPALLRAAIAYLESHAPPQAQP